MRIAFACVFVLTAAACAHGESARSARSDDSAVVVNAKDVLEKHCGSCHVSLNDGAPVAALEVFDLVQPDWNLRLTEAQLEGVRMRVDSPTVNGQASTITDAERALVGRFLKRENRRRVEATSLPLNWRIELGDAG